MLYIILWFFLLIFYDEAKRGLESLTLDLIHIILLPAAGIFYLIKKCKKTKSTSTPQKMTTP